MLIGKRRTVGIYDELFDCKRAFQAAVVSGNRHPVVFLHAGNLKIIAGDGSAVFVPVVNIAVTGVCLQKVIRSFCKALHPYLAVLVGDITPADLYVGAARFVQVKLRAGDDFSGFHAVGRLFQLLQDNPRDNRHTGRIVGFVAAVAVPSVCTCDKRREDEPHGQNNAYYPIGIFFDSAGHRFPLPSVGLKNV